ncbi:MAG TPA: hypothetical protein VL025_01205, partial [Thermoanaerobaculia bacterium]|nr:hypothetical protein [Thermoanaerobaculia bacterium]
GAGLGPEADRRPSFWNQRLSTLQPGPARERPLPPLPVEVVAPRGTLGGVRIAAEWPVRAPGAEDGGVVRLELPLEVYHRVGSLDHLRLETAGRQIPYVLHAPDLPALVARGRIPPAETRKVVLAVAPALTLTGCRLETAAPVDTTFQIEPWTLARSTTQNGHWRCTPGPGAPCVWELSSGELEVSGSKAVSLHPQGPVAADIDVTLWRQRQELVFVWPREGAVRLLAGVEGTAAPTYDLQAVGDQLLARSWRPAVLGPGVEHPAPGRPRQTHKALLGAAALVLLAAVHRLMPRSPSPAGLH